jgi:hypothetical protein
MHCAGPRTATTAPPARGTAGFPGSPARRASCGPLPPSEPDHAADPPSGASGGPADVREGARTWYGRKQADVDTGWDSLDKAYFPSPADSAARAWRARQSGWPMPRKPPASGHKVGTYPSRTVTGGKQSSSWFPTDRSERLSAVPAERVAARRSSGSGLPQAGQRRAKVVNCGRADETVSGASCPSAPGQARIAVDEHEHGGSDRETDNNDHPKRHDLPSTPPTTKAAKRATAMA